MCNAPSRSTTLPLVPPSPTVLFPFYSGSRHPPVRGSPSSAAVRALSIQSLTSVQTSAADRPNICLPRTKRSADYCVVVVVIIVVVVNVVVVVVDIVIADIIVVVIVVIVFVIIVAIVVVAVARLLSSSTSLSALSRSISSYRHPHIRHRHHHCCRHCQPGVADDNALRGVRGAGGCRGWRGALIREGERV